MNDYVSVAMTTYNGARFLTAQLQSIVQQTRTPDELVICDDRSSDTTVSLLRKFAKTAPFDVRLVQNEENLRSTANFAQAIALCRGDVIFLADQDDVWRPQKLARMLSVLAEKPDVALVFSDAARIDAEGRPLAHTLWQTLVFSGPMRRAFDAGEGWRMLARRNVVTGACTAFRAQYRDLLLPIPAGWVHDGWIAQLLAAVARCEPLAEPLIDYRQHDGQQIGAASSGPWRQYRKARGRSAEYFAQTAANYAAARERLMQSPEWPCHAGVIEALLAKSQHYAARAAMRRPRAWRLPAVTREWLSGHYGEYSSGWKSLVQDLFL